MNAKINTITVKELIEILQDQNPDSLVAFSSDYGDYCHTKQVHTIRGECEDREIEESAYSHSGFAVKDDDYNEEQDHADNAVEAASSVLILS